MHECTQAHCYCAFPARVCQIPPQACISTTHATLQPADAPTRHSSPRQHTTAAQRAISYRLHALGHMATSLLMREHTRISCAPSARRLSCAAGRRELHHRCSARMPENQTAPCRTRKGCKHLGMRLFIVVVAAVGLRSGGRRRLHCSCFAAHGDLRTEARRDEVAVGSTRRGGETHRAH